MLENKRSQRSPNRFGDARYGAEKQRGFFALFGRERGVARGHCEAIYLAHDGSAEDFNVHIQIARHAADYQQLLIILLSEDRDIRTALIEQLGDNGGDAAEKMRPRYAAQSLAQTLHGDAGGKVPPIDLIARRHEYEVDTERGQLLQVFLMIAGIAVKILMRRELSRIDEY